MGENGEGKSTLIKVLTGVHPRDGGKLLDWTAAPSIRAPRRSSRRWASARVYQEVNLIPHLSVAENICLGRQPAPWDESMAAAPARRGGPGPPGPQVDVSQELSSCSIAIQQMVAIARALGCVGQAADPRRADLQPRRP